MSDPVKRHLRISIITVTFNRATELERNLRSVAEQDYPWREHIVIDGGSTDASAALLERHAGQLAYWCSEPDDGISDAMNKGLQRASGDLVLFLHADDHFPDRQALSRAMAEIDDHSHIWACDIQFGKHRVRCAPRPFNRWVRLKNPLPHQGVLCPRALFDRLGGFDIQLGICMDYDFWFRAYRAGCSLRRVPQVLAIMDDGGISSRRDWAMLSARFREERRVQWRHAAGSPWRWFYPLYWPLYLGYRRLRLALGG